MAPSNTAKTRQAFVTEVIQMKKSHHGVNVLYYLYESLNLFVQQLSVNNTLKENTIDWFMMIKPS